MAGRKDFLVHRPVLLLTCALLWHRVSPSAIGLGFGGGGALGDQKHTQYEKDASNALNGQSLAQENHNVEKVNENQNSLTENKNVHFVGAKDNGQFVNQDLNKKIYDDNKIYAGQNFNQDFGERAQGVAQKKAHKKGHHNSGFRNSYHKDEVSNNSSFFDDYNDESDQSNVQNGRGRYGNEAEKRYDTRKEDGVRHVQDNTRHGSYDRHGGTDARNQDHHDYDRKKYYSDRRDANQLHRGQNYGGRDREFTRVEAAAPLYPYYERPLPPPPPPPRPYHQHLDYRRPYYDDARPPFQGPHPGELRRHDDFRDRRQTITIYEDPRYHDRPGRDILRQQNSDHVHLEVRPGSQRFQRYDKYYEQPPRDWGVQRRSDINPLVLNRYSRY